MPLMQVKSRSRKFYKCYFDLIETLKTEEVYPFGLALFVIPRSFFLSSNENTIGGKAICEEENSMEQKKFGN